MNDRENEVRSLYRNNTPFEDLYLQDKITTPLDLVKDASLTRMYSFLPASWAGDTHEETDFLPIGD